MPRTYKLTWQPGAAGRSGRWRKKYKGKRYYFSGGRGKSDRQAYEQALDAWEARKTQVDQAAPKPHQEHYEKAIDEWEQVLAWCNRNGETGIAETAVEKLNLLRSKLAAPSPKPVDKADTFAAIFAFPYLDLSELLSSAPLPGEFEDKVRRLYSHGKQNDEPEYTASLFPDPMTVSREVWRDRLEVQKRNAASHDEGLQAHVESYVRDRSAQAAAGVISVGRAYALKLHLTHFQDWLGKDTAVKAIDSRTMSSYRSALLSKVAEKSWSRTTAKHYLTTVKSFVRWLWQIEAIDSLPRNMDGASQSLNIGKSPSEVIVFSKEEINTLLGSASDRTRLYILLMLNCGMTQKDIADLRVSEVDWEEGRIIRRRSKTAERENVPVVNYVLWPETLRLLKEERAKDSIDRVLLNSNGQPIWSETLTEKGQYQKADNVKNAFDRLRKVVKINKPLKSLKKTSATLLRNSERFSGLAGLFLGHAPQTMSEKHYTQVPQDLLDRAIQWLGCEYGMLQADGRRLPQQ